MKRPEINVSDCPVLPSDYTDYGGQVARWSNDDESYPDCSCGCKWMARLWDSNPIIDHCDADFGVCMNPNGPRYGLLTFEHMAGFKCFEHGI